MHLSCLVNNCRNRKAYKTCLKLAIERQKKRMLAKKGIAANIAEQQ